MTRTAVALALVVTACTSTPTPQGATEPTVPPAIKDVYGPQVSAHVSVPGGIGGVGFDELTWARGLGRLLVPAGRTGNLALVSPKELATKELVRGFSTAAPGAKGRDVGTTSADEGGTLVYATDRTTGTLDVVDPKKGRIVARAKLAGGPDHVRWVAPTGEVWVTEPDKEQIEVFAPSRKADEPPRRVAVIPVKGGPEGLVVDAAEGRAYSHLWKGHTAVIDLRRRVVVTVWDSGCAKPRGLELDAERHQLFVGCGEGKAVVLDARTGKPLGALAAGEGIDAIAYSARLHHLYLPGSRSATLTIASVGEDGKLKTLATTPTVAGAHCVATDGFGTVFVCDPAAGDLLVVEDSLPR